MTDVRIVWEPADVPGDVVGNASPADNPDSVAEKKGFLNTSTASLELRNYSRNSREDLEVYRITEETSSQLGAGRHDNKDRVIVSSDLIEGAFQGMILKSQNARESLKGHPSPEWV